MEFIEQIDWLAYKYVLQQYKVVWDSCLIYRYSIMYMIRSISAVSTMQQGVQVYT